MRKKLGSVLIVAFISAAVFYGITRDDTPKAITSEPLTSSDTHNTQQGNQTVVVNQHTMSGGTYITYTEQALQQAEGQKVLFFHAAWCQECRSIEAGIEAEGAPEGYTILKVDYDNNHDLRVKYGVKSQATFVKLDENNNKIDEFVANNEPTFEAVKRDFL